MRLEQRVFQNLNGNLSDISRYVNNFRSGSQVFAYQTGDYLYIGTVLPMNHIYFDMKVANTAAANVKVEIWYNLEWTDAVDVEDDTDGLKQNGLVFFGPQFNRGWNMQCYSKDVIGLENTEIYDMYWTRISWDADLDALTEINYVGQKFSDDDILFAWFPDLDQDNMKASFQTGKTTWDEQHFMASEFIVKDLLKRDILKTRQQILDPYEFKDAAAYKCAEFIYSALGRPYFDQMANARERYKEEMNMRFFKTDKNATGRLESVERVISTRFLGR